MPAVRRPFPLHARILIGMIAGALLGVAAHLALGDAPAHAGAA
jgi:hypothetical protein